MSDADSSPHGWRRWLWGPVSGLGLAVAAATALIDQAHKWWMLQVYDIEARGRVAITPFFDLVYRKNTGVSYGLFADAGQIVLTVFALAVVIALALWLARNSSRLVGWSLGLVIGGALGNAIDRLSLGGVADFFLLHAFGYSWYVFNIADMAIFAGVAGLLYDAYVVSRNSASKPT